MVTEEVESRDAHAPVKISVVDVPLRSYSTVYAVMEKDNVSGKWESVVFVTARIWQAQSYASLYNQSEIEEDVSYEVIEVPFQHAG